MREALLLAVLMFSAWASMWYLALRWDLAARRQVCPRCRQKTYVVVDAARFYHLDFTLLECSDCSRLYVRCSGIIPWCNLLPWERWKSDPNASAPQDMFGIRWTKTPLGPCDGETKERVARWYTVLEADRQQSHRIWYLGPLED